MLPVAVLAGGLATRLGAVTATIPKLLLDVGGRPFAEHQIEWLRSEGVTHVVYCLGHLGEQIIAVLGDGHRWGMRFDYVLDGPKLLGTGGALQHALPHLSDPFFVAYGDSLLTCDMAAVADAHAASGRACLMTVLHNRDQWDRSNIVYRNGDILVYNKRRRDPDMEHIDYGLSVLTRRALESYPLGEPLDLADVFQDQLRAGQLAGYEVAARFYEIGSVEGLEETRRYLAAKADRA
jgi:NDP-sugar pyrophosphorylase family protein